MRDHFCISKIDYCFFSKRTYMCIYPSKENKTSWAHVFFTQDNQIEAILKGTPPTRYSPVKVDAYSPFVYTYDISCSIMTRCFNKEFYYHITNDKQLDKHVLFTLSRKDVETAYLKYKLSVLQHSERG